MLSGDPSARSYDSQTLTYGNDNFSPRPVSDRVSFLCLAEGPQPETPNITRTDCRNGLRTQIHFQSCWDGVNLYKPDQSHVAYMSAIDNGICPPTHPVPLVHLFMETLYSVDRIDTSDGGQFVFSNGDTTGYGFHADFMNGWDIDVLTQALQSCASDPNSQGRIEECPVLEKSQVPNFDWQCPPRPPQIGEDVHGLLASLPGCNKVTSGPNKAKPSDMQCPPGVSQPSVTSTVGTTPIATRYPTMGEPYGLSGWGYLGCAIEVPNGRLLTGAAFSSELRMTVEACQDFCAGYKYSGVEFGRECFCGNVLSSDPLYDQNSACNYRCANDYSENCGGWARLSLFKNSNAIGGRRASLPGRG